MNKKIVATVLLLFIALIPTYLTALQTTEVPFENFLEYEKYVDLKQQMFGNVNEATISGYKSTLENMKSAVDIAMLPVKIYNNILGDNTATTYGTLDYEGSVYLCSLINVDTTFIVFRITPWFHSSEQFIFCEYENKNIRFKLDDPLHAQVVKFNE